MHSPIPGVPVILIVSLLALAGLVATTDVALAARWAGHQTGGGNGAVIQPPLQFEGVSPAPGTSISFVFEAKASSLVPAPMLPPPAPPPPPDLLVAAPGATIQGRAMWVDHSTSPPRVIRVTSPTGFRCSPVNPGTALVGWGTDSAMPGPVFVDFRVLDGGMAESPPADQVQIQVFSSAPVPPPAPPSVRLYAAVAAVSGEVVQHSCTGTALAAHWGGHQTGGGDSTVLPPPPPFAGVSPAPGTAVSFGFVAKADSLTPAPSGPAGTLRSAPDSTIKGHANWVDHSTSPPRTIALTTPVNYRCSSATGQGGISGWGTDSTVPGPVFVVFNTFDGKAPEGPAVDQVFVQVHLAPPVTPASPPLYWANAVVDGGVVQHSCR
ncbi:MAG: hypothetical protein HY678_10025 [Chloroflexi bacterium]|nr:hypothetical protein [Chloroflexota bacterium]